MNSKSTGAISWFVAALSCSLVACSTGPQVAPVGGAQPSDETFNKILVVSLFESFDMRRYLETELVSELRARGTEAIASTSMMNSLTPVVPETFIEMVKEVGADSVLVTQLVHLDSKASETTMRPQASYNVRPTYWYNVFSVELTEYAEPPDIRTEHDLTLLVELISAQTRERVWKIETRSKIVLKTEMERDYSAYVDEAKAISRQMARDGLLSGS
ncbi:MAG TPA: hypothetical protein VF389_05940 [Woeseiaceae bacterium]